MPKGWSKRGRETGDEGESTGSGKDETLLKEEKIEIGTVLGRNPPGMFKARIK